MLCKTYILENAMSHTKKLSSAAAILITKLEKRDWLPAPLLQLAREVTYLQEQAAAALGASLPPLPTEHIVSPDSAEHRQGQALLQPEHFPYDAAAATVLWHSLLDVAAATEGPTAVAARAVRISMNGASMDNTDQPRLLPQDAFAAYVRQDADFFAAWAQRLPEAPAMARFLAQASLTPWLHAATLQLSALAPEQGKKVWEHGTCPHCGQLPYVGQLRGKEGARWHVCSFCQWAFRVTRLQCPVCLERDHQKLHFFTTAAEPGYEVHVCESCKNYMKLTDLREKDSSLCVPPLEDLDSLPLDLAARQQGYVRNTLSAWGF